jgi:hypothetical protein
MSIICSSYQLENTSGVPQVQSFTDCNGNSCSITVQDGQVYFITANLLTFTPNPNLDVSVWDARYALSFSSCCGNDVFHILGSNDESFPIGIFSIGNSGCISEFTNALDCSNVGTPNLGCYSLISIDMVGSETLPLGNQMYAQTLYFGYKSCEECLESGDCPTCCNCYQIDLESECTIEYTDCTTGVVSSVVLSSGTNYLCSSSVPIRITECTWTLTELGLCSEVSECATCTNEYCITNTGNDYDDTYTLDGTYDGYNYWLSNSGNYYIYYSTIELQWCLATSLGGFCLLSGKSPCFSTCPDLCEEYFFEGVCPTTTTTTLACTTFDFEAIFDCLVEPTPSPSVTPTHTPTPTPTPVINLCVDVSVDATINSYSPTPTPTPTITPSSSPIITRPCNVLGDVSFTTVDGQFDCPTSKQFQDCTNGMMYYTTNSVPTPSGDTLEEFMVFKAYIDGVLKCVSYVGVNNSIIGVNTIDLIDGPLGYSNLGGCFSCIVIPSSTPTPTPTLTPTPSGVPCYCYELMSDLICNYTYVDCNGVSQSTDTIDTMPRYVCSLTTPMGTSLNPFTITQLDICSDGGCPPLVCKCYSVSNGGPTGKVSTGVSVIYYDCDNIQQILHVNNYSSTPKFCSLTTPFIISSGNLVTINTFGDCIDGDCPIV